MDKILKKLVELISKLADNSINSDEAPYIVWDSWDDAPDLKQISFHTDDKNQHWVFEQINKITTSYGCITHNEPSTHSSNNLIYVTITLIHN